MKPPTLATEAGERPRARRAAETIYRAAQRVKLGEEGWDWFYVLVRDEIGWAVLDGIDDAASIATEAAKRIHELETALVALRESK